ncbi:type I polyketide synthase, partial [Lacisediminimonas sp.]|uniref:type I polyketide synthase n=1 Tax=Lacisediminimonas sp. TaxID=3060582 RepID=UPI0027266E20
MSDLPDPEELSLTKQALLEIDALQAELDAIEDAKGEPIAIVGMSCRFPGGADDPEAYWQLLQQGRDAISEVPPEHWDVDAHYDADPAAPGKATTRYGGFVDHLKDFDAAFFGIAPREAQSLDPQQRLLLEVAWEAIESAGMTTADLAARTTGVYVGVCSDDYIHLLLGQGLEKIDAYLASGNAHSTTAGRLSYLFGLTGPCISIDTACSSSLVALHLACTSLRNRESDVALATGVNRIFLPLMAINFSKARMLSTDGRCKAFDISADGFVRSEGCGVVLLKRLSDAQRDGDRVLAVIRGSAVNQDGHTSSLTVPNGPAQQAVIRQALQAAQVTPGQISYLEAHGTGTSLGDPIEVGALGAVFGPSHSSERPLVVGSVKTNIGHAEAAAGMAGLIKVVLQLQHEEIAAHLHLRQANPYIDWKAWPIRIPTQAQPWAKGQEPRLAGISSFGFSGTNAHVIVEEAPDQEAVPDREATTTERPLHLLALSAKTPQALQALAQSYEQVLAQAQPNGVADICFTASTGRAHFEHRITVVADSAPSLAEQLAARRQAGDHTSAVHGGKTAFLFTGQGSQYAGMGRQLYETEPVFRAALEQCAQILAAHHERPQLEVLYPAQQDAELIHQTAYTQPALFALEYALHQLWRSWGIVPDAVMGHSVGEYVAACVAGVFSLEDGLALIAARGRLMQQLPSGGVMVAVMAGEEQVRPVLAGQTAIAMAAINGPDSTVLSGPEAAMQALVAQLETQGINCTPLSVSHAFHSPLMAPMLAEFEQVANRIRYAAPALTVISNVTGEVATDAIATAAYWCEHILAPVRFADGMAALEVQGCDIFLECGPRPVLLGMGRQCLTQESATWLPSLRPGQGDWQVLLASLGALYERGASIDWRGFEQAYPQRRKVALPPYPFQRQHYWVEGSTAGAVTRASVAAPELLAPDASPLLGVKLELADGDTLYSQSVHADGGWLAQHRIYDSVIMPAAGFAAMALAAQGGAAQLDDVVFERPLIVGGACDVQLRIQPDAALAQAGEQRFRIYSRAQHAQADWQLHSYGRMGACAETPVQLDLDALRARLQPQPMQQVYERFISLGLDLGPAFKGIKQLWRGAGEALAELRLPAELASGTHIEPIHPALLDACTQAGLGALGDDQEAMLYLPLQYRHISLQRSAPAHLFCYAVRVAADARAQTVTLDLRFTDAEGLVFGGITGFVIKRAPRQAMLRELGSGVARLLHGVRWQDMAVADVPPDAAAGRWLVLGEANQGAALIAQLTALGGQVWSSEWRNMETQLAQAATAVDGSAESALPLQVLLLAPAAQDMDASLSEAVQAVLRVTQTLLSRANPAACRLTLVTQQAIAVGDQADVRPEQTALWGLGRALQSEQPQLGLQLIDIEAATAGDALGRALLDQGEAQLALRGTQILVPRLTPLALPPAPAPDMRPEGSYLITGGLGALGVEACAWLLQQGARHVVLVSRRAPDDATRQRILSLAAEWDSQIDVQTADVADEAQVRELITQFGEQLPALAGVIHAAGVLDDGLVTEQSPERFARLFAPKVQGALHLHQATRHLPLDFFVLYSSVAALLGSPAQSSYAAANAFLDGLAQHRHAHGLCATSIAWGPWSGGGMAQSATVRANLAQMGLALLPVAQAQQALAQVLAAGLPCAAVLQADWPRLGQRANLLTRPLLSLLLPQEAAADSALLLQLRAVPAAGRQSLLQSHLQRELQAILRLPQLPDPETGFFDLGMDSLMAVELRNRLKQQLGESVTLGNTIAFDYPTLHKLAVHLAGQLGMLVHSKAVPLHTSAPVIESDAVAVVGLACRFPGAFDQAAYWQLLTEGTDAITEVPAARWDIDAYYDPDPDALGKMSTRYGGFIRDIDQFDPAFFGIAPREAIELDPQQRLLLEMSWHALEDAGIAPAALAGSSTGVYVGMSSHDYSQLMARGGEQAIGTYMGTGTAHSAAAGRLSYVLGLEGPCLAIDTACSSSLVALHQARRGLLNGECDLALAGGVNVILTPELTIYFSRGRFMAPDGRCKTFDAAADGYVRGEGCGMLVLKRLSDARRDGDRVYGVIRGSAVNQDGASGGLTVPHGPSQERVIATALAQAQIEPGEVRYVEAHGTGTRLGDPIEIQALHNVLGVAHSKEQPLMVGSVKTNIGHLEAAAGMASVIKVLLGMQHDCMPGQLHFHTPSPHIAWDDMHVKVLSAQQPWPAGRRIAGVSGFAFQGTNAHVLLEAVPAPAAHAPAAERPLHLLTLSAKTKSALQALVASYQSWLISHPDADLANIAYTANTGRSHFSYRLALGAATIDELSTRLAALQEGEAGADGERPALPLGARPFKTAFLFTGQGSQYAG